MFRACSQHVLHVMSQLCSWITFWSVLAVVLPQHLTPAADSCCNCPSLTVCNQVGSLNISL
jgi:hypothetical protein